ncbi:MAG TPA: ATP-binding protein [Roseiflexaceae bacterium]|nr:ATP-binding protein [Roseiflexaceae bacterium]
MSTEVAPERLRVPEPLHEPSAGTRAVPLSSPAHPTSPTDAGEIYIDLLAAIRDLLACSGAAVLLPDGPAVSVLAQSGPQTLPDQIELSPTRRHLLARIAQARQPVLVQRTSSFAPPLPTPAADIAWMGVPLLLDDQLHICLSLAGRFQPGDERVVFALAQQTAISLRWFQGYVEARRQAQQEQLLLDLARQVHQTRGQRAALEQVLGAAMACTSATHSFVAANQGGRAQILARRGYSQDEALLLQQIPPSLDRGLTGQAYRTRALARSDDIQLDPAALPALASTRSQLIIPICVEEQVLGLIDLQSPVVAAFQAADEHWMIALGDIAAGILDQRGTRGAGTSSELDVTPQHELLLSSRLAVVNDLAAGVAHEINNPLTTILGYTHLLLRDLSLPQSTRDDVGQIMIEGQRIAALVERFLRFAQPASNGKQPLAINQPLLEALGLLKGRLQESGVEVVVEAPAEPLLVLGQAGQLEQAFLDLLHNAIEAMSTADDRRITIRIGEQGGWVQVAISDTGRGIMPDLLTRVFEPGFTTKVDKGISRGLGLGLYATHIIIQDHWGRIEVQSQIWQGSTFTVFLPAI